MDELLSSKQANCSQQSYLFAKLAMEKGGIARRVGLWAVGGANDVMVEIKRDERWRLFVPSTGVYYPFSLGEILSNPMLANDFVGTPLNGGELYVNKEFFSTIYRIDLYHNLNNVEYNYLQDALLKGEGFLLAPNDVMALKSTAQNAYVAGREKQDQKITLKFDELVKLYRLWFEWYSTDNYPQKIVIELFKEKEIEKIEVNTNDFKYGKYSDIPLGLQSNVKMVIMTFKDFAGQNRLLLKDLGVY